MKHVRYNDEGESQAAGRKERIDDSDKTFADMWRDRSVGGRF